jgi:hypothetical protein
MAGQFIKGALVSFMPTFITPLPNVIVFQYNPETITHAWTAAPGDPPANNPTKPGGDPLAVRGIPGESFSFSLFLDANDMIADGNTNPVAAALASASGVYTRLAALEMLQFPSGSFSGTQLLGSVSASVSVGGNSLSFSGSSSSSQQSVPSSQVPTVLFIWGPQRIVPVRVTELSITEKLYDALLNPIQAEVRISLRVLTPDEVVAVQGPMSEVAKIAYVYTQGLRQVQAAANLADSADSIIGMLPRPF